VFVRKGRGQDRPAGPGASRPGEQALRACAVAVALLAGLGLTSARGQVVTPDLFNPVTGSFNGQYDPLRQTGDPANATDSAASNNDSNKNKKRAANVDVPAPSRIGNIPTYDVPSASGASTSGYDALGRKKKPKPPPPGAPKKSRVTGPGSFIPPPVDPPEPLPPSSTAHKTPLPPALAGTVDGQPQRRKLKIDADPYGAVGFYAGPFLTKAAVEVSGGHDSNPGRIQNGTGSWFYMIAPELVMASDWSRHSVTADLRGSFTGYGHDFLPPPSAQGGASPIPQDLDRPDFTGRIDGRLDVSHDTRVDAEGRLRVSTDNPGSPSIQAGLARYPIYTIVGGTLGAGQKFNRFELSGGGTIDHTQYEVSRLTDGTTSSNDDRNFNQYGGFVRAAYEVTPALKPYAEVDVDRRVHELEFDRSGFARDSHGLSGKAGSTFEFSALLTGDASIGYATRTYEDPRLDRLKGLLTSASLIWTPTALSTVTLTAKSSIDESTLPGVSGVLTRDYQAQLDHSLRRWLIATAKFGYGTLSYDGSDRFDHRYFAEGDLIYKLTRTMQVKGSIRKEWLRSTAPGIDNNATIFMLGMRFQP
jgi:hypothetical protein